MSPFPESIRIKENEKTDFCAVCGEYLPKDSYNEIHSATGLHLVVKKLKKDRKYQVADPPSSMSVLKNKTLPLNTHPYEHGQLSDGYKLCEYCHKEIHRITLEEARLRYPNFKGNVPPPLILQEVTLYFIGRGKI